MLYLFYNGVSHRHTRFVDSNEVEKYKKSYHDNRIGDPVDGSWDAFFNRCYFPVKKTTDIVDIIGFSNISVKINKKY